MYFIANRCPFPSVQAREVHYVQDGHGTPHVAKVRAESSLCAFRFDGETRVHGDIWRSNICAIYIYL